MRSSAPGGKAHAWSMLSRRARRWCAVRCAHAIRANVNRTSVSADLVITFHPDHFRHLVAKPHAGQREPASHGPGDLRRAVELARVLGLVPAGPKMGRSGRVAGQAPHVVQDSEVVSISSAAPSASPARRWPSSRRELVIIPFAAGPTVRTRSRMSPAWRLCSPAAAAPPATSASRRKISACAAALPSHAGLAGRRHARSTLSSRREGRPGDLLTGGTGRRHLRLDQLVGVGRWTAMGAVARGEGGIRGTGHGTD